MTIREAGKGIVTTVGGTYRIGFINMDGQEDETELDAYNMTELEELYRDFCKENGFTVKQKLPCSQKSANYP